MTKFLTSEEELLLTKVELIQYRIAVSYCSDGWKYGPYGGWVRGDNKLKALGWVEKDTTTPEDRQLGVVKIISLIKPEKFTIKE